MEKVLTKHEDQSSGLHLLQTQHSREDRRQSKAAYGELWAQTRGPHLIYKVQNY